ncbi:MAG TPA: HupE/UreJ family protein [Candidatus Acidoferrales bacterium]|nr:HupE/UreJ family protein [Candidatus Acidoferrales bacterium]
MRTNTHRTVAPLAFAVLVTLLALVLCSAAAAHDIPSDVAIQAFVKPAGQHLELLVRVPLNAMRDIDFPRRGPGYLDIARADSSLRDAATLWISNDIELYENETKLPIPRVVSARVSLPSDRSFTSYEEAVAHVTGPPLPDDTELYWNQGMLDVLFEYPIHSDQSRFSIHPAVDTLGLRVVTALRFLPPSGVVRAFELSGDPGLVRLDPRWHQAALRFVKLGFLHILSGTDHLLFLLCLVIPLRRIRPLIAVITAFTVAHSITLIASAYNMAPDALWFPPLIETLIAMSIVYMALENIAVGANVRRRWMITFGFGLVHGFGFSFALRQTMQFAGSHLLTSLLSFNIGVELGQLLVLVVVIPLLNVLFRFVVAERMGTIILSALVAHTGWHWMIDRGARLSRFPWPALNAALLLMAMRALMWILIFAGLLWLASKVFGEGKGARGTAASREKIDVAGSDPNVIETNAKTDQPELETSGRVSGG